jgi:hypothetical protein
VKGGEVSKKEEREELKELAYGVYAQYGGRNIRGMLGYLEKKYGLQITRQTLNRWRAEGLWDARLRDTEPMQSVLGDIHEVIDRLRREIRSASDVDPQLVYAYASMVNSFFRIKKSIPEKIDPEERQRRVEEVLVQEYGISRGVLSDKHESGSRENSAEAERL